MTKYKTVTVTGEDMLLPTINEKKVDTSIDIPLEFTKSKWAWKKDSFLRRNAGYTQEQIDALFDIPVTKLNKHYIAPSDIDAYIKGSKASVEDYFPEHSYLSKTSVQKDLIVGMPYTVKLISINEASNVAVCEEINTGTGIIVPYKEFADDVLEDNMFSVVVTSQRNNVYMASKKQAQPIVDRETLLYNMKHNIGFKVTVTENIRGGFWALYNNTTQVFLPGASAAANKIHDYAGYVGKEVDVMVDNYDSTRRNFIVSAKKYCELMVERRVGELLFNTPYKGVVTDDPKEYGVFVEIDGFYSGKIETCDFEDYEKVKSTIKRGDVIDVYLFEVKLNHTNEKGKKYTQITLTTRPNRMALIHRVFQNILDNNLNKVLPFTYEDGVVFVSDEDDKTIYAGPQPISVVQDGKFVRIDSVNVALQRVLYDLHSIDKQNRLIVKREKPTVINFYSRLFDFRMISELFF